MKLTYNRLTESFRKIPFDFKITEMNLFTFTFQLYEGAICLFFRGHLWSELIKKITEKYGQKSDVYKNICQLRSYARELCGWYIY